MTKKVYNVEYNHYKRLDVYESEINKEKRPPYNNGDHNIHRKKF